MTATDPAREEGSEDATLIERFDALLCDLDGVVYAGPHAIDGAPESLKRVKDSGRAVMYVTNNASRSPEAVAEHISFLGAPARTQDVVSSAQAAAALLAERLPRSAKVLITGAQALADEIRAVGLTPVTSQDEQPEAVVQGFDPHIGWEHLAEAAFTLADDAVLWCATNTDRTIPKERGIAPGNGTLVAAVAAASGREPVVAGKPEAPIFREAAERVGARNPAVVGDRLDTDILGANNAGMPGIEVFTGVDSPRSVLAACTSQRPTYLLGNLRELFEPYPRVDVTHDGDRFRARCREAVAATDSTAVTVTAPRDSLDGWRAACAAWWAAHPDVDVAHEPSLTWQDPA